MPKYRSKKYLPFGCAELNMWYGSSASTGTPQNSAASWFSS